MTAKTYEQLGREADAAIRTTARVRQSVMDMGSPEAMAPRLSVSIAGADWDNGLLHLEKFLTAIVREQVSELVPQAFRAMQDATRLATEDLRDYLTARGVAPIEESPQVPRRADTQDPPAPPPGTPPLTGETADAGGAGPAMPSGPSGSLVPPAEGAGQVDVDATKVPPAAPATALKAGASGLTKPQEETLAYILKNPGCNVGATADVQALVTRKLVVRSGSGPRATYAGTTSGMALLGEGGGA